jgi:plastocyanin
VRGRALAALALGVAFAAPASASAQTDTVGLQAGAYNPSQLSVLTGDTVAWRNQSIKLHTVTAADGSFGSPGKIGLNGGYSFQFPSAGSFKYYCQVHPFMRGEVDVFPVLLNGPKDPVSRGAPLSLDGRAQAGTSSVEIQRDDGSGYAPVAAAAVDPSGAFKADLPATASAKYRAVGPAGASEEIQVVVIERKLAVHSARLSGGRGDVVRVRAVPGDPGATVVLQIQLRERFGWWPVARRNLDKHSSATFHAPRGARARVVLTLPDGWTPVATSDALRLPR